MTARQFSRIRGRRRTRGGGGGEQDNKEEDEEGEDEEVRRRERSSQSVLRLPLSLYFHLPVPPSLVFSGDF